MQTNFRYFTSFKIVTIFTIFILVANEAQGYSKRNPFCFSNPKIKVPFSFTGVAKIHNSSKAFAILSYIKNSTNDENSAQTIIAKKGDILFGYKIIDIFDDSLIVQDEENNEIILHLN